MCGYLILALYINLLEYCIINKSIYKYLIFIDKIKFCDFLTFPFITPRALWGLDKAEDFVFGINWVTCLFTPSLVVGCRTFYPFFWLQNFLSLHLVVGLYIPSFDCSTFYPLLYYFINKIFFLFFFSLIDCISWI